MNLLDVSGQVQEHSEGFHNPDSATCAQALILLTKQPLSEIHIASFKHKQHLQCSSLGLGVDEGHTASHQALIRLFLLGKEAHLLPRRLSASSQ